MPFEHILCILPRMCAFHLGASLLSHLSDLWVRRMVSLVFSNFETLTCESFHRDIYIHRRFGRRSKAVAQGAIPKGRGFEPHRRHIPSMKRIVMHHTTICFGSCVFHPPNLDTLGGRGKSDPLAWQSECERDVAFSSVHVPGLKKLIPTHIKFFLFIFHKFFDPGGS